MFRRKSNGMPERWIEGQNYKLSISGVSFVAEKLPRKVILESRSVFPFNAEIIIKFKSKPREVPPTTRADFHGLSLSSLMDDELRFLSPRSGVVIVRVSTVSTHCDGVNVVNNSQLASPDNNNLITRCK